MWIKLCRNFSPSDHLFTVLLAQVVQHKPLLSYFRAVLLLGNVFIIFQMFNHIFFNSGKCRKSVIEWHEARFRKVCSLRMEITTRITNWLTLILLSRDVQVYRLYSMLNHTDVNNSGNNLCCRLLPFCWSNRSRASTAGPANKVYQEREQRILHEWPRGNCLKVTQIMFFLKHQLQLCLWCLLLVVRR